MIPQANDFKAESMALYELLANVEANRFSEKTQFKKWTVNHILQHLHYWNTMADLSLVDEQLFVERIQQMRDSGLNMRGFESYFLDNLSGKELLIQWHKFLPVVSEHFLVADPKMRLKWGGPDMSARSSITARLMETWAHGQEIYDHFGVERINTDRIKNIAYLGVNTYGWTYAVRGRQAPDERPYIKLNAPSGDTWKWNAPNERNFVFGDATEFCQVVTQSRNVAETQLTVVGDIANEWMSMAQCFAGAPEQPPAVGTRFKK